ncbi:N-acetylglucosamine-6-phosphate deacetylase [compost metagenome]
MIDAVEFMHSRIGLPFEEAVRMASLYPAEAMGVETEYGHLRPGAVASFVHLSDARKVRSTWISGAEVYRR